MTTVQIIEDYEPLRVLYDKILRSAGYTTIQAGSCQEALDQLHVRTPDVILLDFSLPDGDGRSVVNYLSDHGRFANTRLVTVTGNDQYRQLAEDYGIEYFLYKPVSMPMLLTLVKRLTADYATA